MRFECGQIDVRHEAVSATRRRAPPDMRSIKIRRVYRLREYPGTSKVPFRAPECLEPKCVETQATQDRFPADRENKRSQNTAT